ncbi:peptide-methionine (R)-S-oxide reductase [Methylohalomonas lacus]|uniref:peptide-methionine (R)-S-oxide reductase n=1 Tax=Methylohalomonas lacus TaxID=398773 RepID=A0AAE3L3K6_9GAMM|nr:peptide-methionine (R)-S-oxide reductase MsrB [Methylohalomonas lacus]MCS3902273.1 peptide-methionine (R)-S-oxide reductase [Methylohalomonas lacus]
MNRRHFVLGASAVALTPLVLHRLSYEARANHDNGRSNGDLEKIRRSEDEWREILTKEEFHILREEGTEPAGSSKLNDEDRDGTYVCAGCELPLFKSEWKYDSRTGWPSFWDVIHEHIGTKVDRKLFVTRTEYHCARCGGHQGHVFDDGPEPTGKRWCNNGLALKFVPA